MVPNTQRRRRSTRRFAIAFALLTAFSASGCAVADDPARPASQTSREPGRGGAEPANAPADDLAARPGGELGSPAADDLAARPGSELSSPAADDLAVRPGSEPGDGPGGPTERELADPASLAGQESADLAGPGHELAGALHGRTAAYLNLEDAASRVDVRMARLPGLLYRIVTPAGSGLAPRVTGPGGRVRVALRATGDDGPDTVAILLNQDVRWDVRLPAGAGELHLDLAQGRLARLELGGAGLVDLSLPRPAGTVPVTLTAGAGDVELSAPRATAVRVRLGAGAGSIVTPWGTGSALVAPGWAGAVDRYVVDARAEVGALRVS